MKKFTLCISIMFLLVQAYAQWPSQVKMIDCPSNKVSSFKGDLSQGEVMDDLSWASTSSNACFPATQNKKFRGNHVFYAMVIPPYSEVKITVVPDDKNSNFSIYGYQIGISNYSVVPNLATCVSCEADHKWDYAKAGKVQDHTRSIQFNSTTGTYNIFIGVSGAEGVVSGTFTLNVDLVSRIQNDDAQEKVKLYTYTLEAGKEVNLKGKLEDGVKINDLSWAWRSSVACFPETQKPKFTGNHVLFVATQPEYTEIEVTVVPDDKNANFSIYAYQVGEGKDAVVPNLSSCMSCEAEHKWDYKKAGKTQDHTRTVGNLVSMNGRYKLYIGVVGANGLASGGFILKIKCLKQQ